MADGDEPLASRPSPSHLKAEASLEEAFLPLTHHQPRLLEDDAVWRMLEPDVVKTRLLEDDADWRMLEPDVVKTRLLEDDADWRMLEPDVVIKEELSEPGLVQEGMTQQQPELYNTDTKEQSEDETDKATNTSENAATAELNAFLGSGVLNNFFTFKQHLSSETRKEGRVTKLVHTGRAICSQASCRAKPNGGKITFTSTSRSHLTLHYKRTHPELVNALAAAIKGMSHRGFKPLTSTPSDSGHKGMQQLSMDESLQFRFNQEESRKKCTRWLVERMIPLDNQDCPYFRDFVLSLNPNYHTTSRRTTARDIEKMMAEGQLKLQDLLFKQKHLATTADSWSAHHRAFLGMTVHWIDRQSLKREHGTLACRELKDRQTHKLLGRVMSDVIQEFGIRDKVISTTTDNGANYVAALNAFTPNPLPDEDAVDETPETAQQREDEEDAVLVASVETCLNAEVYDEGDEIVLPPIRRCSAHTLSLLATNDVKAVAGWSQGNTIWRKATAKSQALWNLQNRATVAANSIMVAAKRKLKTPVAVRWNSFYESVVVLLEVLSVDNQLQAINHIIMRQPMGGSPFTQLDIQVLTEYKDVMAPVAMTLDSLQGEASAYMGNLLPTLYMLKVRLLELKNRGHLSHAKPLLEALLSGFENRFQHLFEDHNLLMASATHPWFTPKLTAKLNQTYVEDIKSRVTRELKNSISTDAEQPATAAGAAQPQAKPSLFSGFYDDQKEEVQDTLEKTIKESMQSWKPDVTHRSLSWSLFPKVHREEWVDLFIRYNTPLPSSAAVERMFCTGGDILRAKRSSLAGCRFEHLVFLKGNMRHLGHKILEKSMEEEKV